MPGGRPPKYETEDQLQTLIDSYWKEIEEKQQHPTISGLALHLGLSTEGLRKYGLKDEFGATVREAKQRVEMYVEQKLFETGATGPIFHLKCNYGWQDTQVHQVNLTDMTDDALDARLEEIARRLDEERQASPDPEG